MQSSKWVRVDPSCAVNLGNKLQQRDETTRIVVYPDNYHDGGDGSDLSTQSFPVASLTTELDMFPFHSNHACLCCDADSRPHAFICAFINFSKTAAAPVSLQTQIHSCFVHYFGWLGV